MQGTTDRTPQAEKAEAILSPVEAELNQKGFSRRRFMTTAAVAGVAFAAARFLPGSQTFGAVAGGPTDGNTEFAALPGRNIDEKVVNFALTLEILEADLYRQALNLASGRSLTDPLNGNPSVYKRKVDGGGFSSDDADAAFLYLTQFAYVEANHRDFLTTVVKKGGGPSAKRNPGGYNFGGPVQPNMVDILVHILPLEETGVRAYLGALPYLDDLAIATAAGSIYSTEARHSAVISYALNIDAGPRHQPGDIPVAPNPPSQNTFEYYLKPTTVLAAAGKLFNK